jgi:hypothetical protein
LAASLGVLAVGALAASPAMAFDDVDWDWKKDVREKVDIDVYIDVDVESTGLVEVEKLQIFLGDVKAESYVHDIDNNPFYKESEYYKDYYVPEDKKKRHGGYGGGDFEINIGAICYALCLGVVVDDWDKDGKHRRKDDDWDKIPVKPLDARVELPIVLSAATAVGNNQSITSDVPVFLHDGQYVADVNDHRYTPKYPTEMSSVGGEWEKPSPCVWSYGGGGKGCGYEREDGNAFVELAEDFLKDALYGKLKEADIEAYSKVWDIKNASVDSSATAVANNISVTLASDVNGCDGTCTNTGGQHDDRLSNHIVIADITQFAYADVRAKSEVYDVSATGYDHMRKLTTATLQTRDGDPDTLVKVPTPWISSVATAVGNNVSITVGPDLTN